MRTDRGLGWAVGVAGQLGYVRGRGFGVYSQARHHAPELGPKQANLTTHAGLSTCRQMSTHQRLDKIRQKLLQGGNPQFPRSMPKLVYTEHDPWESSAASTAKPCEGQPTSNEPALCSEQVELVDLILKGNNVFYTGSAGCGKSTVLKVFVNRLRDMGQKVRVVAPTGRAALHVDGETTWSFAGMTPDSHRIPLKELIANIAGISGELELRERVKLERTRERLRETDVLVIDEVSMVENLHFERLNEVMKAARDPSQPFGGCQIVVTGDFCQLPPVKPFQHCIECGKELKRNMAADGDLVYDCLEHGRHVDEDKWAFKSKAWIECKFVHVHLKAIHRQNDQTFIRMLQKCRLGELLEESEMQLLLNHECETAQATELYCTRREAEAVNQTAFKKLVGRPHTYWANDQISLHPEHRHLKSKEERSPWRKTWGSTPPGGKLPLKYLGEHRFSECVELKEGMLVMLLANINLRAGLCNGSQGIICGFKDHDPQQLESQLASDGREWMRSEIDRFIDSESAPIKKWPVVQFHNGMKRTIYAEFSGTWLGDVDRRQHECSWISRTQIPLAPAWAFTVHKCQGLTLNRVIVNLDRAFEAGQVYVALSRATGLEGLKIEGNGKFLRDKLMVNAEVTAFMKEKFDDMYKGTEAEYPVPKSSS